VRYLLRKSREVTPCHLSALSKVALKLRSQVRAPQFLIIYSCLSGEYTFDPSAFANDFATLLRNPDLLLRDIGRLLSERWPRVEFRSNLWEPCRLVDADKLALTDMAYDLDASRRRYLRALVDLPDGGEHLRMARLVEASSSPFPRSLKRKNETGLHLGKAQQIFDVWYQALINRDSRNVCALRSRIRANADLDMFFEIQEVTRSKQGLNVSEKLELLDSLEDVLQRERIRYLFPEPLMVRLLSAKTCFLAACATDHFGRGNDLRSVERAKQAFACIGEAFQVISLIECDVLIEAKFLSAVANCLVGSLAVCEHLEVLKKVVQISDPGLFEHREYAFSKMRDRLGVYSSAALMAPAGEATFEAS